MRKSVKIGFIGVFCAVIGLAFPVFNIFSTPCRCAPGPPRRVRICAAKFYMGKCWNFHPDMV